MFALLLAACVPATKYSVCGNVLRGPPRSSLRTSKLHQSPMHKVRV